MKTNTSIEENHLIEHRCRIANQLKEFREKKGYSQEQLAEKMEISRTTISKIESGKFNFSIDYLSKFSFVLDFDLVLLENPE